ncbi:RNase HII [Georgenia muralis]|uniref:Ribonuclease n=1 Tax=Georgenia muralis TaxID=154117 RepID=A0A3N5A824_9MICO|nr:RNase HII [Georgenia muralis]
MSAPADRVPATRAAVRSTARRRPSRSLETALLAELGGDVLVAGMDEVGRGALAGPVTVGVAVVGAATSRRMPRGLADSKLLTARAREDLVDPVHAWCADSAVGHAGPEEIDRLGIIAALRLAGRRALAELAARGRVPAVVILDGVHDWLSDPEPDLFSAMLVPDLDVPGAPVPCPPVRTQVKADAACAVVAAASVLAKVARDRIMVDLAPHHPRYGWEANKGYSSAEHIEALREDGTCELHRRSWRLPGLGGPDRAGGIDPSGEDVAACEDAVSDDVLDDDVLGDDDARDTHDDGFASHDDGFASHDDALATHDGARTSERRPEGMMVP